MHIICTVIMHGERRLLASWGHGPLAPPPKKKSAYDSKVWDWRDLLAIAKFLVSVISLDRAYHKRNVLFKTALRPIPVFYLAPPTT